MDEEKNSNSNSDSRYLDGVLTDIVTGRPADFRLGARRMRLYPATLAKTMLLRPVFAALGVQPLLLKASPTAEVRRVARAHREECCHILAVLSAPNTYRDTTDTAAIGDRCAYLAANIEEDDLAAMMLHVLTSDRTEELMQQLGISRERERLRAVLDAKEAGDRGSMSFGGVSLLGAFIAPLKEMGYTDEEILYGRGYSYLRLMLADKPSTVYLTDKERDALPNNANDALIMADDPEAMAKLAQRLGGRGLRL